MSGSINIANSLEVEYEVQKDDSSAIWENVGPFNYVTQYQSNCQHDENDVFAGITNSFNNSIDDDEQQHMNSMITAVDDNTDLAFGTEEHYNTNTTNTSVESSNTRQEVQVPVTADPWLEKIVLMTYDDKVHQETIVDRCKNTNTDNIFTKNICRMDEDVATRKETNNDGIHEALQKTIPMDEQNQIHNNSAYRSVRTSYEPTADNRNTRDENDVHENNNRITQALSNNLIDSTKKLLFEKYEELVTHHKDSISKNHTIPVVSLNQNDDDEEESEWETIDYPIVVGLSILTRSRQPMDDISEEATSTSSTTFNIDDEKGGMGESNHTSSCSSAAQKQCVDVTIGFIDTTTTVIDELPCVINEEIGSSCIDEYGLQSSDSKIVIVPEQTNNFVSSYLECGNCIEVSTENSEEDHVDAEIENQVTSPDCAGNVTNSCVIDIDINNTVITQAITKDVIVLEHNDAVEESDPARVDFCNVTSSLCVVNSNNEIPDLKYQCMSFEGNSFELLSTMVSTDDDSTIDDSVSNTKNISPLTSSQYDLTRIQFGDIAAEVEGSHTSGPLEVMKLTEEIQTYPTSVQVLPDPGNQCCDEYINEKAYSNKRSTSPEIIDTTEIKATDMLIEEAELSAKNTLQGLHIPDQTNVDANTQLDSRSDHPENFESFEGDHTDRTRCCSPTVLVPSASSWSDKQQRALVVTNDMNGILPVSKVQISVIASGSTLSNTNNQIALTSPEILNVAQTYDIEAVLSKTNVLSKMESRSLDDSSTGDEVSTIISKSYPNSEGNATTMFRNVCSTPDKKFTAVGGTSHIEKFEGHDQGIYISMDVDSYPTSATPDLPRVEFVNLVCESHVSDINHVDSIRQEMLASAGMPTIDHSLIGADFSQNISVDIDPLDYYELIKIIGVSSMGSVAEVRMRQEIPQETDGSLTVADAANTTRAHEFDTQKHQCFQLPLFGTFLRVCTRATNQQSRRNQPFIALNQRSLPSSNDDSDREVPNANDSHYFMKAIHMSRLANETSIKELKHEVGIIKGLNHPHIVQIVAGYEYMKQIFVVTKFCSGGNLYSRDPYKEIDAAKICKSVLSAVAYMHSKGIVHGDLNYENILFATSDPNSQVKLTNFGINKKFGNDSLLETIGTIHTMAPEMIKGSYTKETDLYSVGVVAYMLLSGQMPFCGRSRSEIIAEIVKGKVEFEGHRWQNVTRQARLFVMDLVLVDPNNRATADTALLCRWLKLTNMTSGIIDSDGNSVEVVNTKDNDEKLINCLMPQAPNKDTLETTVRRATFLKLASIHSPCPSMMHHYRDMFL